MKIKTILLKSFRRLIFAEGQVQALGSCPNIFFSSSYVVVGSIFRTCLVMIKDTPDSVLEQ